MRDPTLDGLLDEPGAFDFFQAVRLLERVLADREPVGGFGDPEAEVVRFGAHPSLGFPAGPVEEVELAPEGPARMVVNFMGLTGPQGVLPQAYTTLIQERLRDRDTTLRDFLDLFNHRMVSLFYRAWRKYRFGVSHEAGEEDPLLRHLIDLVGLGVGGIGDDEALKDEELVFYAGLLAPQQRGALALEQLVEGFFDVPVEVEQFVGGWYPIPRKEQCAVGEGLGVSDRLGEGAVVGDEVWDQQARVRLRVGPVDRQTFDAFLPDGRAHATLKRLTRLFGHGQFDFELQLILDRDDVPGCVLGDDDRDPPSLGWGTWLKTRPGDRHADETILML